MPGPAQFVAAGGGLIFIAVGIAFFFYCFRPKNPDLRLDFILCGNLFLFYGLGCAWTALVTSPTEWADILADYDIGVFNIFVGFCCIIVFTGFLCLFGKIAGKYLLISKAGLRRKCVSIIRRPETTPLLIALLALQIFAISAGYAGNQTTQDTAAVGEVQNRSPITMIVTPIALALLPICILRAGMAPGIPSILMLAMQLLASVWFGRWTLLIMIVNGLLLSGITGMPARKLIALAGIAAIIAALFIPLILGLRFARFAQKDQDRIDAVQLLKDAVYICLTNNEGGSETFSDSASTNAIERPFFHVGYLSLLAPHGLSSLSGAGGELIIESIMNAVPSFLTDAKDEYIADGQDEGLTMRTYQIKTSDDMAISIVTGGLTDFGVFGLVLYPLLAVALCVAYCTLYKLNPSPIWSVISLLPTIHFLLTVQGTLTSWFLNVRFMLLVLIVGFGWSALRFFLTGARPHRIALSSDQIHHSGAPSEPQEPS